MPWDWIAGQTRVVNVLRSAVASDRVAQAYLFHGPDGSGKRVAALALAQALQCETRKPGEADPCGECNPCRKVAQMIHPDVHFHLAQPKDTPEVEIGKRRRMLADEMYTEISYRRVADIDDAEKSSGLKRPFYDKDRIRDIISGLRYTSVEGRYKVLILTDVDTMREDGASIFLKTLEEPTPRTTFILTTTRPDQLLSTIISRCQRLRFDLLLPEDIEEALRKRPHININPSQIPFIARMGNGSLTQALSLAGNQVLIDRRELGFEFLRHAYSGKIKELEEATQNLAKLPSEPLIDTLSLLLTWVRDLHLVSLIGSDALITNVDKRDAAVKFTTNLPNARYMDMVELIEQAITMIRFNTAKALMMIVLADGLRDAMRGKPHSRLTDPLVRA